MKNGATPASCHRLLALPPGKSCAVSLTYDDGLAQHAGVVAPALAAQSLRATFYAPVESSLLDQPQAWRALVAQGHELGNHSVFHPCRSDEDQPLEFVDSTLNLVDFSDRRMHRELATANGVLALFDSGAPRSYGNTCCHTTLGARGAERSLTPLLPALFVAARGRLSNRVLPGGTPFDAFDIGAIDGDARSFEELSAIVGHARDCAGWAVLMIHGVGSAEHGLHIDAAVHQSFTRWLIAQADVWVAPLREVVQAAKTKEPS